MNNLYEIIFENISSMTVLKLLEEISEKPNELLFNIQSSDTELEKIPFNQLLISLDASKDLCIGSYLHTTIWDTYIKKTYVGIYKYETVFDVEFSFYFINPDDLNQIQVLKKSCNKICTKFNIVNCYAGMEPASDCETQIFKI